MVYSTKQLSNLATKQLNLPPPPFFVYHFKHNSVSGHSYNGDVETTNADIPYSDTFMVWTSVALDDLGGMGWLRLSV